MAATKEPSMLHLTCSCGATLRFRVPGFSPSSVGRERSAFDKAHAICREKTQETHTS